MEKKEHACCSCGTGCCDTKEETEIVVDYLYLDLNVCKPCQETEEVLDEAVSEVSMVLKSTNVNIIVNKIHIHSKEEAIFHKLESSPTIRINGNDIDIDIKETSCKSCGDLCGEDVNCRVWVYQGNEYTTPPKAMIIDAIFNEIYGSKQNRNINDHYILPENLEVFFTGMDKKKG